MNLNYISCYIDGTFKYQPLIELWESRDDALSKIRTLVSELENDETKKNVKCVYSTDEKLISTYNFYHARYEYVNESNEVNTICVYLMARSAFEKRNG